MSPEIQSMLTTIQLMQTQQMMLSVKGGDQAELPGEREAIAKAMEQQQAGSQSAVEKHGSPLFESGFATKHGIRFRSDPPDIFAFEYGADGEVIIRDQRPANDGGGDAVAAPGESPSDEEQEQDNPFAIKVKVTGKGIGGDWSTVQLGVVSGKYATAGGSDYDAGGVAYPGLAYDEEVTKANYTGFVYLLIPLVADNTNGVPAANVPNKVRAVGGGFIKLWKAPIPVWPHVSRTNLFPGVAVAATAVHIGSWGVSRVNTSPAGIPTYDLRVQINQNVSDNIVLGDNSQYGDVSPPPAQPWQFFQSGDATVDIKQPLLLSDIASGTAVTVTGVTGLTLGTATTYWLKGAFNSSGAPTGWEATTTAPAGGRVTFTGSGTPESPFVQTGAWYPLGRVINGSNPQVSGFDFISGGSSYHLEQLCNSQLVLTTMCFGGRVGIYPRGL